MAYKLQRIDGLLLPEHSQLTAQDRCYFFGEYVYGVKDKYQHSPMNQLIFNLKKPLSFKGKPGWHYKQAAIEKVVAMLRTLVYWDSLSRYTWVPVPPSKGKRDAGYDDRLVKVLDRLGKADKGFDARDILSARASRESAHTVGERLCVGDHLKNWAISERSHRVVSKGLVVFDDVITSGASFKAAKWLLEREFPSTPIIGIFVARAREA